MAVGTLASNESMRSELKQTVALEDDLRIQRSVLSSTQRIDRIATQSYGMVAANGAEKLSVSDSADTASEGTGTADEATDAQATDAAPDATQAQKSSDEVAQRGRPGHPDAGRRAPRPGANGSWTWTRSPYGSGRGRTRLH